MTHDQAARSKAITQKQKPLFLIRVIRVINQAGVLVQENRLCFLKRDAVFAQVGSSFFWRPRQIQYCPQHYISIIVYR
jgi:hypothetical protein